MTDRPCTLVELAAVIVAVTDEVPRVLVIRGDRLPGAAGGPALVDGAGIGMLPMGPFDPARHRTLELGLRSWVAEQTGLDLRYVEQLYTFGDRGRDPRELDLGLRVLTVAYLALTQQSPVAGASDARWCDWYSFLPWEDWRAGRPAVIETTIRPGLMRWIDAAHERAEQRRREERAGICFALGDARWDAVRTLERVELLYQAGLLAESHRDRGLRRSIAAGAGEPVPTNGGDSIATGRLDDLGVPMALDNRRILATALSRLRGKLAYRPVVFDLLPGEFTLLRLQRTVEALAGTRLHKQNFRRTLAHGQLVEATGRVEASGRGRPAELYQFRRDVLRAKPAVGVALPTVRAQV